jgi:RNA polymerase sigma factor (sigma-70 family)
MARAFLSWDRVGSADYASARIARVSTNLATDEWRRRARTVPAGPPESRSNDEEAFARRVDLHKALGGLSGRQRQVVLLRYIADQSEATTASVLGCSIGSVKKHGARGLAALRTATELAATKE